MMNTKHILSFSVFACLSVALFGQGCPTPMTQPEPIVNEATPTEIDAMENEAMEKKDAPQAEAAPSAEDKMMPQEEPSMEENDDVTEARVASTYAPFTKSAYEAARAEEKPILLFFYASWCPYCIEQDPRFARVIPEHEGGVVAFRVNYNDQETDADEQALAREFGVTYQHTMFFIGTDGETKKKAIGTITDEQTREYLDLISN